MQSKGPEFRKFRGFPPEAVVFLRQLKRNNRRDWFQAHKDSYLRLLREPMEALVLGIGEAFLRFAPEMVAEPKLSIYRIYRDTRFSRDKSPYKTQAAAVFPVRGLPKNSGPGLYFHVSPAEVLIGGGIYMPGPELLRTVRQHIAAHPGRWLDIVEGRVFRRAFGDLEGEQLKKTPKGFPDNHPAAQYLRYKQFLFGQQHPAALATSPKLLPTILRCFEQGMPLIRFLAQASKRTSAAAGPLRSERSIM